MKKDINEICSILEQKMKKKKSLPAWFRKELLTFLKKYDPEMLQIKANKIICDVEFFAAFSKKLDMNFNEQDKKSKENKYYKYFNQLIKYSFIHKSSSNFAKALILKSINPNSTALLTYNFKHLDSYLVQKENIKQRILKNDSFQLFYIYIYLRLFTIKPFSKRILEKIDLKNLIKIKPNLCIQYVEEKSFLKFNSYTLIIFDKFISKIFYNLPENNNNFLFSDIRKMEETFDNFRKKRLGNVNLLQLKKINELDNIFKNCVLYTSIYTKKIGTVPLTLSEVDALYPNKIPIHLMQIENEIIQHASSLKIVEEDEKDIIDTFHHIEDTISGFDIYELYELMNFLNTKSTIIPQTQINKIIRELDMHISLYKDVHTSLCIQYILYLIGLMKNQKLRASSVRGYIRVLNKHLFKPIECLQKIQAYEIESILKNLYSGRYKANTIKSIIRIINRFFAYHFKDIIYLKVPLMNYHKSLVFEEELDEIIKRIEEEYLLKHNIINKGSHTKFDILQQQIIIILAFYSGMRKNELRTRLVSDLHFFDDCAYIDVNNEGLRKEKLKLKTNSSKRRIKIHIPKQYFVLFKKWYNLRISMKKRSNYLFLKKSNNSGFLDKVIEENTFNDFNKIIQSCIKRYVSFHSLRHSFLTYSLNNFVFHNKISNPYSMIELCNEMGHITPEITLSSYCHADLLYIMSLNIITLENNNS